MRINHNISSMVTQGSLFKTNRAMGKNLEKLSTGLRINSAADDAAGLGVSENLRTQVKGIHQATKNTQDVISMLNIAEGALNEMSDIMQRMRELVVQAKNDTYTQTERNYMGEEFQALGEELERIALVTNYNGMTIFANSSTSTASTSVDPKEASQATEAWGTNADAIFGANDNGSGHHFNMMVGQNFTSGDANAFNNGTTLNAFNSTAENLITIQMGQMDLEGIFCKDAQQAIGAWDIITGYGSMNPFAAEDVVQTTAFTDVQGKLSALQEILDGDTLTTVNASFLTDWAIGTNYTGIDRVNRMRAYIGAMVNRLEHNMNNLMEQEASQQAAESQIRDVDFASETAAFTKNQILTQSATSMLSQANMQPQSILQLLG